MSGALDAVKELAAKASGTPWVAGYQGQGTDIWAKQPEEHWHDADLVFVAARLRTNQGPANAALATVAVNNIQAAVKALEKAPCALFARGYHCAGAAKLGVLPPKTYCPRCAALAAIEREAKEALA